MQGSDELSLTGALFAFSLVKCAIFKESHFGLVGVAVLLEKQFELPVLVLWDERPLQLLDDLLAILWGQQARSCLLISGGVHCGSEGRLLHSRLQVTSHPLVGALLWSHWRLQLLMDWLRWLWLRVAM